MQIGNYICKEIYGITICKSRLLLQFRELNHFVTTRKVRLEDKKIKELDLSFNNEDFDKHYKVLFEKLGLSLNKLVFTNQVHGNNIEYVSEEMLTNKYYENIIKETDGLITDVKGIYLVAKYADCVPIIAYDPIKNVVGVAHSGWRGTLIETPKHLIIKMVNKFGSDPSNIFVSIGPSIGPESFEVGKDVAEKFVLKFGGNYVIEKHGKFYINLWQIVEKQIAEIGVRNIEVSMIDTFKNIGYFYSYRKEKTPKRFAVVVGLVE